MKRMNFATLSNSPEGVTTLQLVEPGFDDKVSAAKGARDLSPGEYYLVSFDSPEPVVVAPPQVATRNVAKFGRPFVEREKKAKPKVAVKAKK